MTLSNAIKDGQAHVVEFPHKSGTVEWPILDKGTLVRWKGMALELEQENEGLAEENGELHECLNDLYMAILEAGWMPQRDEQWVTLHVTPEQIEQLEELLGDDDG